MVRVHQYALQRAYRLSFNAPLRFKPLPLKPARMYQNTYIDTRAAMPPAGEGEGVSPLKFSDVVLAGAAPSGGLFVPKVLPRLRLEEICGLAKLPYSQRAALIFERFGLDFSAEQIR